MRLTTPWPSRNSRLAGLYTRDDCTASMRLDDPMVPPDYPQGFFAGGAAPGMPGIAPVIGIIIIGISVRS
jgi:hypothetical protein